MKFNLPNTLTLLRVALIPVLVVVFFLPFDWMYPLSAAIYALAGVTDWLDGYYARKLGQTSAFGAFLDPVADKVMVTTALVLLVWADHNWLLAVAVIVIIGREITISALREWMSSLGVRKNVAVSWLGKFKTAAQMLAAGLMLYRYDAYGLPIYTIGLWLLYVAAILTLWSMILYLLAAWPELSRQR
ncbi:MAG: CDP-diacylglycerol--glycerol-3-phosphate 3-phosphatidyltransferase [Gammaproteobacteria bacterium]